MNYQKRFAAIAMVLMSAVGAFACGCNTVEGIGEDIESGGERIEDAADNE